MPVWHERTRSLREAGELQVVGLVQEQHADRAALYAAWRDYDWPILWDPFNVTGSKVVPLPVLIDEYGVVRKVGARWDDVGDFLAAEYTAPYAILEVDEPGARRLGAWAGETFSDDEVRARAAMSRLLWTGDRSGVDDAVAELIALAERSGAGARDHFRAGVAARMRFDASGGRASDSFQVALDRWRAALQLDPNQYIWRRRIQQYGPRLDKPYPFYDWVDEARATLAERGTPFPALLARLTPAERMQPRVREAANEASVEPDPDGRVERGPDLLTLAQAVAFDTDEGNRAMVHVAFRPGGPRAAKWNNEVEPLRVWLDASGLPDGVELGARSLEAPLPPEPESTEVRRLSFEVGLAPGVQEARIPGYALFHTCLGSDDTCLFEMRRYLARHVSFKG